MATRVIGPIGGLLLVLAASCGESSSSGHDGDGESGRGGSAGFGGSAGRGGSSGTGGDAGGGGLADDCSVDATEIDGQSFQWNLASSQTDNATGALASILFFENTSSGLEVVVGSEGQAFRGRVGVSGSKLVLEPNLRLRDSSGSRPWSQDNGIVIEELELCFHPPRDSSPSLDGKGTLRVIQNADDYDDEREEIIDFVAGPDVAAPSLPEGARLHPLKPSLVRASEPLALGGTAWLIDEPGTALSAVELAQVLVGWRTSSVLPLGVASDVMTNAHDLSGLTLGQSLRLTTEADPGVQPLDGFESELRVADYTGTATLVGGDQALAGMQSLLVRGDSVLHIVRPASDANTIRFDLKVVPDVVEIACSIVVRAGVIGGEEIVTHEIPLERLLPEALGAAGAGGEGGAGGATNPVQEVELSLSEAGDDILLSIETPFIEESASCIAGALVDRLRVE